MCSKCFPLALTHALDELAIDQWQWCFDGCLTKLISIRRSFSSFTSLTDTLLQYSPTGNCYEAISLEIWSRGSRVALWLEHCPAEMCWRHQQSSAGSQFSTIQRYQTYGRWEIHLCIFLPKIINVEHNFAQLHVKKKGRPTVFMAHSVSLLWRRSSTAVVNLSSSVGR